MRWLTTDRIISMGLVAAMIVSLVMGGSVELQTTIAAGLIGYLSKEQHLDSSNSSSKNPSNNVSKTLDNVANVALQTRSAVDAIDNVQGALKNL